MPLTLPTGAIRNIEWMSDTAVSVNESPFTYRRQVYRWSGQRRRVLVDLKPLNTVEAKDWHGFFLALNGPEGTFYLQDTVGKRPHGKPQGLAVVDGAEQTGQNLSTRGWIANVVDILKRGDWISIEDRLYQATAEAESDASGNSTLELWPYIGQAYADGTPIEYNEPRGIFRLSQEIPSFGWTINRLCEGMSFEAVEVVAP